MKKLLCTLVLLCYLVTPALSASRTAVWDANPAEDEVIFYTLYMDGVAFADVYGTSHVFTLSEQGTHETYVTATNADGESGPSNIVTWRFGKPTAPKNHKVNK